MSYMVSWHQRGEREGDRDALRRAGHDLDDAAERVAHDCLDRLAVDGQPRSTPRRSAITPL